MNSLPTSDQVSTSNGKVFRPYWNPSVKGRSDNLWLPTKTGCQDLGSNLLDGLSSSMMENSWFSIDLKVQPNRNLRETCSPSYMSSLVGFMDLESTVVRSRKIRAYLNAEQRQIYKQVVGISRYTYNETVKLLKDGRRVDKKGIKTEVVGNLPDWSKLAPYQVKAYAAFDACKAVSSAKKKCKSLGKPQDVGFRSRKDSVQSIGVPKSAVKRDGIYITVFGKIKYAEDFEKKVGTVQHDCRMICDNGRYYLVVPVERHTKCPENQRAGIVALDPGVRTFQTFYSEQLVGKVGAADMGRIQRLCYHLDRLMSKIPRANHKRKYRLKKAATRLRFKIKNLISEIHKKLALFLVRNFDVVVIPEFETQQMASNLSSRNARSMYTWAHYSFRRFLKEKCEEYSTMYVEQCEAYTSKTCSSCGQLHEIGKKKTLSCSCGCKIDRDINGARGIFLRALEDNPSIEAFLSGA